ncbi:MAG: MFS transporter [Romboutsia sp.]|uniref:MFS transporter n=1 Tax=Romboutsia sp. TaxID=1965302 RepID=UPI003F32FC36
MTKFYAQYLALFIGLGAYNTFLPVYLENTLGFSSSKVGMIVSIPSIIGILFVPIWGLLSDLLKKQKSVLWINILMSLLFTGLYVITESFVSVLIVATFLEMFRNSILPLTDSLTTSYCKENDKNYGGIRVIGSMSFAIASFLCGQLIKITNNDLMFFYVFMVSMIGCLIVCPTLDTTSKIEHKEKLNLKEDLPKLFKNKAYILILLCGVCIASLTEAMMAYQGIHLMNLGAGTELVGLLTVFMVIPELYFMVKSKDLVEKYGMVTMIGFASLSLLLRWSIYMFTSNPWIFMIATSMHGVSISIITICAFDFIGKVVDKKLYTTSMTVYTFTIGVSYSLMKLLYGTMIDSFGINSIFIFSIAISLFSFVVLKWIKNLDLIRNKNAEIV